MICPVSCGFCQVYDYLSETCAGVQTAEAISACLNALKPFNLTRLEQMQVCKEFLSPGGLTVVPYAQQC